MTDSFNFVTGDSIKNCFALQRFWHQGIKWLLVGFLVFVAVNLFLKVVNVVRKQGDFHICLQGANVQLTCWQSSAESAGILGTTAAW